MSMRGLLLASIMSVGLLLIFTGPEPARVAAQIPTPSGALTALAVVSTDGHGIVVNWTMTAVIPAADFFVIYRRSVQSLPGSAVQLAVVTGATSGYTDYSVGAVNIWCYQVVAVVNDVPTIASPESCVGFLAGLPGTASPVIAAGCSRFYQSRPVGTPMTVIAAQFTPVTALISLWRFDSGQQRLVSGYFAAPSVPADFAVLPATNEFEFACLTTTATYR